MPNPGPGQVELSAVRKNGQLLLQVSDNGIGDRSHDAREVSGDLRARDATVKYRRDGQVVAVASVFRDRENLLAELALEAGKSP